MDTCTLIPMSILWGKNSNIKTNGKRHKKDENNIYTQNAFS